MGVHTRPAFLHLQVAVMHPILQLQNTRSSIAAFEGQMNFLNPLEEVDLLASPNPTVYNPVHFHDTYESALYVIRLCCLIEPDVGGRVLLCSHLLELEKIGQYLVREIPYMARKKRLPAAAISPCDTFLL